MISIFVELFKLPFKFLRWVMDNGIKGWIIAAVVLVSIIIAVLLIQNAVNSSMSSGDPSYSEQLMTAGPDRADAPYKVVTDTRVYYAYIALQNEKNGTVTMTNYYELSYGEWLLTEGVLVLDENYGTIQVTKRGIHE